MVLVVPQRESGFAPTSSPRVQYDGPDLGQAVATLGDAAYKIGIDRQQADNARAMRAARVGAMEALGEMRSRYDTDPDATDLFGRFETELDTTLEEQSASLPEHLREDFLIEARSMAVPHLTAINAREYGLVRDSERAGLENAMRSIIAQAAAAPDAATRDGILDAGASELGAAEGAGYITAQEAEESLSGLLSDVDEARAIRLLDSDPAQLVADIEAGEFLAIEPGRLSQIEVAARRSIRSAEAQAATAQRLAEEAAARELAAEVDSAVEIIESGRPYRGLSELIDAVEGTPEAGRLSATISAAATEGNFAVLPPLDQRAVIADIRASATNDPADVDRLERLESMADRSAEALDTDPLSHLAALGVIDLAPVDLADPESVRARVSLANQIALDYRRTDDPAGAGASLRLFTDEEVAILSEDLQGTPDQQLALAGSLVTGFGDMAPAALAEVGAEDPLFQLAGHLVAGRGTFDAARVMLQGRKLIEDSTGARPNTNARNTLRARYSNAFPPGGQDRLAVLFEAADAHFAASGFLVDPDADPASARAAYDRSVQAVSGGTVRNGVAYGGVQMINNRPTLLPATMDAGSVMRLLANEDPAVWDAASATGSRPLWGGMPLIVETSEEASRGARRDAQRMRNEITGNGGMKLVSRGGGLFNVGVSRRDGSVVWLEDNASPDGLFYLDLESMDRAARQVRP